MSRRQQYVPPSTQNTVEQTRLVATAVNQLSATTVATATPQQFGAKGDGTSDDGPAFVAAIASLSQHAEVTTSATLKGSRKLFIPSGDYNLGTTTLDINHTLIIEGESSGMAGGSPTALHWSAGTTGIRIQDSNTSGASTVDGPHGSGQGTVIRGLAMGGGYTASSGNFHAIHARARVTVEDCYIGNWEGEGIFIDGASSGNANCSQINRVRVNTCRNGIKFDGGDGNAGLVLGADCSTNREWGFYDSSFLGNTFVGCHAEGNASGPYKTDDDNARALFLNCYAEPGQGPSEMAGCSMVLGGLHGDGVTDGGFLIVAQDLFKTPWGVEVGFISGPDQGTLQVSSHIAMGNHTGAEISDPIHIDMGATISDVAGAQPKLMLYNDGVDIAGIGISDHQMDFIIPSGATQNYAFWMGGTQVAELNDVALTIGSGMVYKVNGTQVVGAQGAAVADATDAATAITQLNALLARCRAHGLIAT